jgi:3-oxoacyl-[acyl-carrier protein] reductase
MSRLDGRIALVVGGAGGIGASVAHALAVERAVVAVADLDDAAAAAVAAELPSSAGPHEGAGLDVTDADAVDALVDELVERHGRLDVLVCSAGGCRVRPILELDPDDVRAMWEVHALGTFLCIRAAARHMRAQRYGRVVAVVSGPGGYGSSVLTGHYQAAKSAQTSIARSMALELGPDGVTVNCVSPGLVETGLWERLDADYRALGTSAQAVIEDRLADRTSYPLGRSVRPDEVAHLVVFLALAESGAINGEVIDL